MANRQGKPDGIAEFATFTRGRSLTRGQAVMQHFGGRTPLAPQADEGGGDMVGAVTVKQGLRQGTLVTGGIGQHRVIDQTGVITFLHLFGRRRFRPFGHDLGPRQQALCLAEFGRRHDQRRDTLLTRAAGPARTVQQRFAVRRQIGVDHQFQTRQVDAARGHIGRDADPRPAIAQRLQRMHPFRLRQLTRQRHNLETTVAHARQQVVHVHPGLAEHDRGARFIKAQDVEDRMFLVTGRHVQRAIFDVDVLLGLALRLQTQRIALERFRQFRDFLGHRGREHQRATLFRGGRKDEFQIFGKAQVQHFIGFVQHGHAQLRQIQAAALDMVAQTAGGADHDMGPTLQRAAFIAIVHAPHAGGNLGACLGIEPGQFAGDLLGQFARRRNDQRKRGFGKQQTVVAVQHFRRHGETKGNRLARPGLRRNKGVASGDLIGQNGLLHGGKGFIALGSKRRCKRCRNIQIGHVDS